MSCTAKRVCYLWGYAVLFSVSCTMTAQKESPPSGSGNIVLKRFPVEARQGVAVDETYFYAISNTRIVKCDKGTGKVIATWQADTGEEAYEHFKKLNGETPSRIES